MHVTSRGARSRHPYITSAQHGLLRYNPTHAEFFAITGLGR